MALIIFINLLIKNYSNFIDVIVGPYLSLELAVILKSFFNSISFNDIKYCEIIKILPDFRFSYLLNYSLININKISSILLIASNPRVEAPLYNTYLRKSFLINSNLKIYSIFGSTDFLSYPVISLGNSLKNLIKIISGLYLVLKYFLFDNYYNSYYFNIKNLITLQFVLGSSALTRIDSNAIYNTFLYLIFECKLLNNINFLQRNLGRINFAEINLGQLKSVKIKKDIKVSKFLYLLGLDNNMHLSKKNINVFQGFFYISNFFNKINLILPTSIYIEQTCSI